MADTKTSALPAAGAITGAELVYVVQAGNSRQTTIDDVRAPEVVSLALSATVTGTSYQLVGSVYLLAGTILAASSRAMIGTDQVADTADLEIRRFTGAAVMSTISATGVLQDTAPGGDIVIAAADWYDLYLRASVVTTTAIVRGLRLVYS